MFIAAKSFQEVSKKNMMINGRAAPRHGYWVQPFEDFFDKEYIY
jgi:hypothetical protein